MIQTSRRPGQDCHPAEPWFSNIPWEENSMNETANTTVAAKGATAMNRRWFLASAPVAAAALSIPAVAIAATSAPAFNTEEWLETADPIDVAAYHIKKICKSMKRANPGHYYWHVDPELRFVLATETDPQARLKFHIEGVKQAMQEIDPTIKRWDDGYRYPSRPELRNRFLLTAYNYDPKAVQS
ncbi:hypothetical protein [Phyllobacterium chamaecytisi]|uniref:hypothetical protein n=1 Tax=Phyllobacterium chamaecytisi TaxID=2876082 RepID=UPI001CCC1D4D|nr:hypothetical protein [Phyllobacterium sp. KW56]MBZ9603966.1 hypothetical protein [Phyllobacterium sp. KW56]